MDVLICEPFFEPQVFNNGKVHRSNKQRTVMSVQVWRAAH